jgi:hypothetical protein
VHVRVRDAEAFNGERCALRTEGCGEHLAERTRVQEELTILGDRQVIHRRRVRTRDQQ